jgi:hypothetical protein
MSSKDALPSFIEGFSMVALGPKPSRQVPITTAQLDLNRPINSSRKPWTGLAMDTFFYYINYKS